MKVSVVIPAYNSERTICEAIESVLTQSPFSGEDVVEVIVVDNASTDATLQLVQQRFGNRVITASESRPGPSCARNTGVALASGEWIAFLDADDLWLPGKLARQCEYLRREQQVSMVFCHSEEFSDPPGEFPCNVSSRPDLRCVSMLARREVFDVAGLFPEFRSGEFIAWYGWTQSLGVKTAMLPEMFVRRRVHSHNTTRDRSALADYPRAMAWLLDKRRELSKENP
jgi:glycosyltransferase involved in cell wall biosynthesis